MDENSRKRAAGGFGFSRRALNLSFKETNLEDRSIQYCNRIGCSTRFNSMKGTELSTPEKPKFPRTSFRSMSSKAVAESSSKPFVASTNFRKPHRQRPHQASSQDIAETSTGKDNIVAKNDSGSQIGKTQVPAFNPIIAEVPIVIHDPEDIELPATQRSSTLPIESPVSGPCKQISRRAGSNNQDIPSSSSSLRRPVMTRDTSKVTKPSSQFLGAGPPKYGLKNLSSSISDVLSSGCSSFDIGQNRRVASVRKRPSPSASVRKRPSDGESTSSGGRSESGSSSSSRAGTNGSVMPQQSPRRSRNRPLSRDGPVSVRTRRASGGETKMRLPEQQDENIISVSEPTLYPQLPSTQLTIREVVPENTLRSFHMEPHAIFPSSFGGRQTSSGRSSRGRLVSSHPEESSTHGPLGDRDGYPRFNMEGIAEVCFCFLHNTWFLHFLSP